MRLIDADNLKFKFEINFSKKPEAQAIYQHLIDIVDDCPTVAVDCSHCDGYEAGYSAGLKDAERPQGEWIMQRHDLDGCFYTCSNCGRMIRVSRFIDDPDDNETLADYPFCHCGAKMKGGAE